MNYNKQSSLNINKNVAKKKSSINKKFEKEISITSSLFNKNDIKSNKSFKSDDSNISNNTIHEGDKSNITENLNS